MGSIIGIDLDIAMRKCARAEIDDEIAEDLLAACERGAVTALRQDTEDNGAKD